MAKDAFRRWLRRDGPTQSGIMLLETLVLLSVFGVLGTVVAGAVQTSYLTKRVVESQAITENLIRNQLEYTYQQPYLLPQGTASGCLPAPPAGRYCPAGVPAGAGNFAVTAEVFAYPPYLVNNLTKIKITVTHDGVVAREFYSLRANR